MVGGPARWWTSWKAINGLKMLLQAKLGLCEIIQKVSTDTNVDAGPIRFQFMSCKLLYLEFIYQTTLIT